MEGLAGHVTQLSVNNVSVEFGATTLFTDVSFTVSAGDRWGIIGRNGTGKTTLFRLITGEMAPTRGVVSRPNSLRVSLLEQHRNFGAATTVWEAAAGAFADEALASQRVVPRVLAEHGFPFQHPTIDDALKWAVG